MVFDALFQSTLPRGERQGGRAMNDKSLTFQSTLPRGERPLTILTVKDLYYVSIHAPAWGATQSHQKPSCTRSVSIHAPAWGATTCTVETGAQKLVSIHAPAWGATLCCFYNCKITLSFNPRSRVGSDVAADFYQSQE